MKLNIEYEGEEDLYDVTNLKVADMVLGLIAETNWNILRNAVSKKQLDFKAIAKYINNEVKLMDQD